LRLILANKPSDRVIDPSIFPRLEEILKIDSANKLEVALKLLDMLDDIVWGSLTSDFIVASFDLCLKSIIKELDEASLIKFKEQMEETRKKKEIDRGQRISH